MAIAALLESSMNADSVTLAMLAAAGIGDAARTTVVTLAVIATTASVVGGQSPTLSVHIGCARSFGGTAVAAAESGAEITNASAAVRVSAKSFFIMLSPYNGVSGPEERIPPDPGWPAFPRASIIQTSSQPENVQSILRGPLIAGPIAHPGCPPDPNGATACGRGTAMRCPPRSNRAPRRSRRRRVPYPNRSNSTFPAAFRNSPRVSSPASSARATGRRS